MPDTKHLNPAVPRQLTPTDDVDLYAAALRLSAAPRKTPIHQRVLNWLYWGVMLSLIGWILSMAIDRNAPIEFISREIINPEKKVAPGEQVLVHAVRKRDRQCPLLKRHTIIDGSGRRHEYNPEPFAAYGPITDPGKAEEDVTGPKLHADIVPGRGRLVTTLAWHCNALQRAIDWPIVYVDVLEFEIIAERPR